MPEKKYMLHSEEDFTGMLTNQNIKDGMVGYMVSRDDTVKQYKKYENKQKTKLKALKKKNNMLYRITKHSGLRHEIIKINKIQAKG